jgi:uncharacterized membrane protein HdeD (DUF308 family)
MKPKSYLHWVFTNWVVGLPTLVFGIGLILAGLQELEQPQPTLQVVSLVAGIILLIANPILYFLYRKEQEQ